MEHLSPENALIVIGWLFLVLVLVVAFVAVLRRFTGRRGLDVLFDEEEWERWMRDHHGGEK